MVADIRRGLGRDAQTRFLIIDAQSVKNTDTAEEKGYDAGKKVSVSVQKLIESKEGVMIQ